MYLSLPSPSFRLVEKLKAWLFFFASSTWHYYYYCLIANNFSGGAGGPPPLNGALKVYGIDLYSIPNLNV